MLETAAREERRPVSVRAEPAIGWQRDRVFFVGMAVAILATTLVAFTIGFLRTELALKLRFLWVQAHAVTFIGWLLLFFTQTVLVASRRLDFHRRLGVAGAVLASFMMLLAVMAGVDSFRANDVPLGLTSFLLFTVPHIDMIIFVPLVVAGLVYRRQPETHKRLMLLATIILLDFAVTGRLPMLWRLGPQAHFVVLDMFVFAAVAYDFMTRGRVNPAYVWGGLPILLLPPASEPAYTFLKNLLQVQVH